MNSDAGASARGAGSTSCAGESMVTSCVGETRAAWRRERAELPRGERAAARRRCEEVAEGVRARLSVQSRFHGMSSPRKSSSRMPRGDEIAGDGVDEQVAEAVAGERGVEAGLEQVVGVAVDEREVEGDAALAGAQEVAGELAARGEGVGERAVAAAQRGSQAMAVPASPFQPAASRREAFVEDGVELDGALARRRCARARAGRPRLRASWRGGAGCARNLRALAACRARRRSSGSGR